jgi:hypothetical protein
MRGSQVRRSGCPQRSAYLLCCSLIMTAVQGCVHKSTHDNVLSEVELREAAATCHIKTWAYKRQRGGLPFIDIIDPDYASTEQAQPTPATACLKKELAACRYDFIRAINS